MWSIEWNKKAKKQLNKLDPFVAKNITQRLKIVVASWSTPSDEAKPLTKVRPLRGDKVGLWKLRFNDYRLVCEIIDHKLIVIVLNVGHRKEVYEE
ncbi:toxin RelG [Caedimonas varicaedens]|uniref:Toxin RelG n=1 Tax=Caedimonas varicaedens TaxID=1629334 RepID=A0A0K8MCA6_9PROT|nr:toxin RelG [Caedimonas varicaedens]